MPWQVWVAITLLIVTVVSVLGTLGAKNPAAKTRSLRIGVVTTFGRPGGTLSNGLHWKAPWQSVTEMNGTIQIDNHTGENATTVRLGNNSTAFVDNSVRWRIQPAAADELFLDYRDFENVRDNLVTRELRAALNEVFADFDPLAPENVEGANVQALGDEVAQKLRAKVGGQIEILNVIFAAGELRRRHSGAHQRAERGEGQHKDRRTARQDRRGRGPGQRNPRGVGVQRSERAGEQVPGRRSRGWNQPAGLLAEYDGGADRPGKVAGLVCVRRGRASLK